MKKVICLTAVSLAFLLVVFSCQKSTDLLEPLSVTEDGIDNLAKKGGKGKPQSADPIIHSFSIGGVYVVENNDVINENITIDLSATSIPISFHVSNNSDPIKYVLIRLYSDWNNDNIYSWGYEMVANINKWEFSESTLEESVDDSWNGLVYPLDTDPIDTDETIHYEIYDHLLTGPGPDHYRITISVQCIDRSHFSSKSAFLWVNAARGPDPIFHVSEINFVGLESAGKNKFRPIFEVTVKDGEVGVAGATVFAQFTGIAESAFPTPHNDYLTEGDGVAIIKGPILPKRPRGNLIMTIKNVRTAVYGGYNPGASGNVGQKTVAFPQ